MAVIVEDASSVLPLPKAAVPGAEMAALAPFYANVRWTGHIEAGGMGPGSPEMLCQGQGRCQAIQGGLWFDCDFQQDQRLTDGTFVLRWQLHWTTGWDPAAGEYRAACADNNGPTMALYRGRIEGDRLIYEPVSDELPRIRLTWQLLDAGRLRWRNEITFDGTAWGLIEEYDMAVEGSADRRHSPRPHSPMSTAFSGTNASRSSECPAILRTSAGSCSVTWRRVAMTWCR